jgi:4a-hydroxytetrahydrobiopterin dehydratase
VTADRDLAGLPLERCRKGTPALNPARCQDLLQQLPGWQLVERDGIRQLQCSYRFPDFASALRFTNAVGALAEAADHHPALLTEWGKVQVNWWTHTVQGLHLNDFILAARCDQLPESRGRIKGSGFLKSRGQVS